MSTLLLDASVILAAFDAADVMHAASRTLLSDSEATLETLDLARYEATNVAVCAWRSPGLVGSLLQVIDGLGSDGGVRSASRPLLERAASIAEQHAISVYDATYVAAAEDAGATLVSCDVGDLIEKGLASSPAAVVRAEWA